MGKCRWGIISTGNIANRFVHDLALLEEAEVAAVGSRTLEAAEEFAGERCIPRTYGSYEELAADPGIDVVYIGTPHPLHMPNTMMCLDAGKAVLCEKPLGMNAGQAGEMVKAARERNLFLMEGMWTHFFPVAARARELIADGRIGDVRMVHADFGFRMEWDPASRLLDPGLGGGSLLDVGVYPVAMAQMAFGGEPKDVTAIAHMGETGVDEQAGIVLGFESGGLAVLSCAVRTHTETETRIYGTDGWIRIRSPFFKPDRLAVGSGRDVTEEAAIEIEGHGFTYEIREVIRCLAAGELESPVMPHANSLGVMRTLDRIREQCGLRYPGE